MLAKVEITCVEFTLKVQGVFDPNKNRDPKTTAGLIWSTSTSPNKKRVFFFQISRSITNYRITDSDFE
jgi:hypothetical protein